jgi:RNA recognition motif-containing protein
VVDPKRALARGGKETEKKIFVGGLDPSMTEDEVKTYFTRYGKVTNTALFQCLLCFKSGHIVRWLALVSNEC